MTETTDIIREFGDTLRVIVGAVNEDGTTKNISAWTSLKLFINPKKEPLNNDQNIILNGSKLTDGTDGMMYFVPTGTEAGGNYFYEVKAIDSNSEKRTILSGRYRVVKGAGTL